MDEIWIANRHLKVGFNPRLGGRVVAIFPVNGPLKNKNLLWFEGDKKPLDTSWLHGGMPLLFPFAGWVWDGDRKGAYHHGDKHYSMPIHGFAHYHEWDAVITEGSKLSLVLLDTEDSRAIFPWKFKLQQEWRVSQQELIYQVTVKNLGYLACKGPRKMPLSLGLHPYFSAAAFPYEQVCLESHARSFCAVNTKGKAGEEQQVKQTISWDLKEDLHHNAILCNFPQAEAQSLLKTDSLQLMIEGHGDPSTGCMVTWSDRQGRYFCLEPWMGKPDALNEDDGLKWLSEGESLTWSGCLKISYPNDHE